MSDVINRIQGFLNESKTAFEANPKQIKAIEDWIKRKIKKQVRLGPGPRGTMVSKVQIDGAHGELCSSYEVSGTVWDASNEEHPNTAGARFDLNWKYKAGGSNGTGLGAIFLDADGKIIQEHKPF